MRYKLIISCEYKNVKHLYKWKNRAHNNISKKRKEFFMAQITTKELGSLSDLLTMEENLIAKCKQYASETTDMALKSQYEQCATKHQNHFNTMVSNLK